MHARHDFLFLRNGEPLSEELGRERRADSPAAALAPPTAALPAAVLAAAASTSCEPGGVRRWDVNSGQMLLTSRALADLLVGAEPPHFNASMALDQVIVQAALRTAPALGRFRTCVWPLASHAEHCTLERRFGAAAYPRHTRKWPTWRKRTLFEPPAREADAFLCALVSYHATCRADVEGKEAVMRMAIRQRGAAACAGDPARRGGVRHD